MTIRDLKLNLLDALTPRLVTRGFSLEKAKHRFTKRVSLGSWWFVLDWSVYENLHVKPAMGLRVDEVERIFHRTSGFERKYHADTPTLSLSVPNLIGDLDRHEYVIHGLDDVDAVAAQLDSDFGDVVLPYFEAHSTLAQIDKALNDNPEGDSVHYLMDYLRCAHGLIVARVIGRANYQELRDIYRLKLSRFSNGFYLPKFDALIADLEA